MRKNLFNSVLILSAYLFTASPFAWAETSAAQDAKPPFVGEVFGQHVTKEDFDFAFKSSSIFSISPKEPQTDNERRQEAWKNIVFLKEAETEKVTISKQELEKELSRLLAEKNITYGSYNYFQWVQDTFKENHVIFEKRVENLLKIKKLLSKIMNPPPPNIKEEDAKQKFLNQYNSMATEFVNFPTLEEANAFYKKTTAKDWDEEKKKNPKFATPTGHISLEAVIDLWQVPKDDAYRIHAMKIDEISTPAKMYKGYGVFRLKEKKDANPAEYDEKKKEQYINILKQVYYYNNTQKIIQDIIKRADLKDYEMDKVLIFETSAGNFEVQLYPQVAPKACENFMALAEKKYYDGLIFHRVIKSFMIQGGDPTGTGRGGESIWGKPFEDEVSDNVQFEKAGILAMANSGPNTNGSQFFITLAPTPHLNKKHTIFGEVISGFEIVHKIGDAPTDKNDRPLADQKIIHLTVKKWQ